VTFDPTPEKLPSTGDELSDLELVLVTGWRYKR
jgi:hypothetical protein